MAPGDVQSIDIFKGCLSFLSTVTLAILMLCTFPQIALWLPDVLFGKNFP
jgi:TRAP-type mannitol/chloroaromatic compound transport system permease large subunit